MPSWTRKPGLISECDQLSPVTRAEFHHRPAHVRLSGPGLTTSRSAISWFERPSATSASSNATPCPSPSGGTASAPQIIRPLRRTWSPPYPKLLVVFGKRHTRPLDYLLEETLPREVVAAEIVNWHTRLLFKRVSVPEADQRVIRILNINLDHVRSQFSRSPRHAILLQRLLNDFGSGR